MISLGCKSIWGGGLADITRGVSHCPALPFTLKSILRQKKKNDGNSNISPCKNIIFKRKKKIL
jgi:hypothetical protein